MRVNYFKPLFVFIFVVIVLCIFSNYSAHSSLTNKLANELPVLVELSLKNASDEQKELARISKRISTQQAVIETQSILPVNPVGSVSISSLTLTKSKHSLPASFNWQYSNHAIYATVKSHVTLNYGVLLIEACVVTALLILLSLALNKLTSANKIKWQKRLENSGFEQQQAQQFAETLLQDSSSSVLFEQLSQYSQLSTEQIKYGCENQQIKQLTAEQYAWFSKALELGYSIDEALKVALANNGLEFDLANQQVIIHGLAIRLPKTPLFYYFWYAKRKADGFPAYLNPPQGKPDSQHGQQLAALMAENGGHQKAIRDLCEEGLKGKSLDQNRNKIKTELQRVLGELADDYLFNSERDAKTARYKYILKLEPEFIDNL